MFGYVLQKPTSLSETVWACKTCVDDYDWKNRNRADQVEFCICSASERTVLVKDRPPMILRGTTVSCVVGDVEIRSHAETGVRVEITTVAVRFPTLSAVAKELEEEDFRNPSVLLVPHLLADLTERELLELERLFHQYIQASVDHSAAARLRCSAIALDLLSRLDHLVRKQTTPKREKYSSYYVLKADSIIHHRYAERLTLTQVARELEITPSYLSALYKSSMGVCFSDRLAEVRVKKAEHLLVTSTCSVSEIAERVGLGDESNLRKRFKQYFGMNLRAYRCVAREQTLYHDKPIRAEMSGKGRDSQS